MKRIHLIIKSFWHYRRANITVAIGMAVSMAVITGALVIGDSVRGGLKNLVSARLGNCKISVSSGDRHMTDELADRLTAALDIPVAGVLKLDAAASAPGRQVRIPKVQVLGVDAGFDAITGTVDFYGQLKGNEAIISDNLASRLGIAAGEELLLRIKNPGTVPIDAPFVSDENNIVTTGLSVKIIAGMDKMGRFNLKKTQEAPFNVFVSKTFLQNLVALKRKSNLLLLAGEKDQSSGSVEKILVENWTISDAGLDLSRHPLTREWILRTRRVFFDPPVLEAIEQSGFENVLYFSYFVNNLRVEGRSVPYSFISTLPGDLIGQGEVLINSWVADDLGAKPGDSLSISYFMVGPLRDLVIDSARFRIRDILPMSDQRNDRILMPDIPGLSDAGNCRDWETSIPVDLSKIRDKDESYWNTWRGTPKAYINPGVALKLWTNRFGSYTQARFKPESDSLDLATRILGRLKPSQIGYQIENVSSTGIAAARSGVDFGQLFLGLSFFLVISGIILSILLVRLSLENRTGQVGTLKALGWSHRSINQIILAENSVIALSGVLIGLILTFFYTILIFKALNGVWNDIVLTDTLRPVFRPLTLALGAGLSYLVALGSAWFGIKRHLRQKPAELQRKIPSRVNRKNKNRLAYAAILAGMPAFGLFLYGLLSGTETNPVLFFLAGTLMLLFTISLVVRIIRYPAENQVTSLTRSMVWRNNILRNSGRSLTIVILFAIGIFLVIGIGANRKVTTRNLHDQESMKKTGFGGYLFYMESTIPVPDNLNRQDVRVKYGLETSSEFVQLKKLEGDDASCLNLNRVSNPPLLGIPAGAFAGRFGFLNSASGKFRTDPWEMLENDLPSGAIPAIADQTVIRWGLGLKTGDTLRYRAESGDTVNLVLLGGLDNSIFQGNILISFSHLSRLWPSASGTNIFLVSGDQNENEKIAAELQHVFRDYGVEITRATQKLAEFNSVENTYLAIFLVLGAIAMLIGTVGLAVILARSLQERRPEIAILRSTGFSKAKILGLVFREYGYLLILGIMAGGFSSLITVLPMLLNKAEHVSYFFLLAILLILVFNGIFWILLLGSRSIRNPRLVESLRDE